MFKNLRTRFTELWPRSVVKVISWRATVTLSNFAGAWWVTGSLASGVAFAGYAVIANTVLYYLHERGWNRTAWARALADR